MTSNQDKLTKQIRERIRSLPDEELLRMLDGERSGYTPDAWEVGCQEISRRRGKEVVRSRLTERNADEAIEQVPTYNGEGLRCDVYDLQNYAGFWTRTAADWIDAIILSIFLALIGMIGGELAGILGIVLFATYHLGFKAARGTTPGYRILGIKIVSINGADVTINQIAVRQISSLFSALPCGLGFLWIAFDANKQSWHDKVAGTYVVKAKAEPIGAIGLPRTRVVRVGLFATLAIVFGLFIAGAYVATVRLSKELKGSEAFRLSEEYLKANSWMQQEVGAATRFDLVGFNISPGRRIFTIRVFGDRAELLVRTELEVIREKWMLTEAGYDNDAGDYVDLTRAPGRKKEIEKLKHPD